MVELGGQGVGNFNTIYLKSSSNEIFVIEINSSEPPYDQQILNNCEQPIELVDKIVRVLQG